MNTGDLTRSALLTGDVRSLILRLCCPSVLAMLASSLGVLADALMVSGFGAAATAAVGLSFPLVAFLQAVGFTLGMGAGSFTSRSLGGGDAEAARRAASSALAAALILPAALGAAGFFFARPLLTLLGATRQNIAASVIYARFVLSSGPLLCAELVLSSLLRGEGRTWPHFFACASGSVLGVFLCWLLAVRMRLSVAGAGIALFAREALTLLVLAGFIGKSAVRPCVRLISAQPKVWAQIMRSGLPTLLRQGLISVCAALLSRQSAAFGEAALAGMGLATRVGSLFTSAVIGFGQGFQPVCGFAYGAGDVERIRKAYGFCQRTVGVSLALLGGALFVLALPVLRLTGAPEDVAQFGARVLRAQAPVLFAQGAVILMNMLTQSMGQTVRASLIATSRQGYLFIPLVLLLPRFFGETGLVFCQTVSDLLALPLCLLLTRGALPREDDAGRKKMPRGILRQPANAH